MDQRTLVRNILAFSTVVLLLLSIFTTVEAIHYHNLYTYNPKTKTTTETKIKNTVTTKYEAFNPDRSQAYDCKTQSISASGVGMVCTSPDDSITISCTTTAANPGEYFC